MAVAAFAVGCSDSKVPVVVSGAKKVDSVELWVVEWLIGHAAGGSLFTG